MENVWDMGPECKEIDSGLPTDEGGVNEQMANTGEHSLRVKPHKASHKTSTSADAREPAVECDYAY